MSEKSAGGESSSPFEEVEYWAGKRAKNLRFFQFLVSLRDPRKVDLACNTLSFISKSNVFLGETPTRAY